MDIKSTNMDNTVTDEQTEEFVSSKDELNWMLSTIQSTNNDEIEEITESQAQRTKYLTKFNEINANIFKLLDNDKKLLGVEILLLDNINKKLNEIYEILNDNEQILLYSTGKNTQKLVSIVEILKQLIKTNTSIKLLEPASLKEKIIQERNFKFSNFKQYNKLELIPMEFPISKSKNPKKLRKGKLEKLLDPNKKNIKNVPIFCIYFQLVNEEIDSKSNDYENLKLINKNWSLQLT